MNRLTTIVSASRNDESSCPTEESAMTRRGNSVASEYDAPAMVRWVSGNPELQTVLTIPESEPGTPVATQ